MSELQIVCLGDFQVTIDGTPLTAFQTDKSRALLAYLAIEDQVHQRTTLAQFLWPGYGEENARNSLRQTLHQLRQSLQTTEADPPWLALTRQTVQINPAANIYIDVVTFKRLLAACTTHLHTEIATCATCLAQLRQAVDLYHGDFLWRLSVIDSDEFEEWRRITQEQLHIQMLNALALLANAAESNGDDEGALHAAQRQLALEPWLETAHRQIMRVLANRGERARALAQYQRCRQVLAEELGVDPDAETTALYEQIQGGRIGVGQRKSEDKKVESSEEAHHAPQLLSSTAHLPTFSAPLVGRAQAMAEVDAQLQRPGVRLLTLIGPGGMGKTRLAIAVGHERVAYFTDGVWFVPLAPISTATALASAIAAALGLTLQGSEPQRVLCQLLQTKQLLLILDNFEHLLVENTDAVDLVAALLNAAPRLQILVTSRARLHLPAEQLYLVQALTFSVTATLSEAAVAAAVRLFVQAVQRVQASFQLTAANLAAVLRICHLVQGMPLGLELAAANAGSAPLTAIADALAASAEVLTVDRCDLPERQRSMRAVFAWSWRLLSHDEQRIVAQSAIFRGGFDYTAAQGIIGATIPLLARLVDKSLIQWQPTATGEGRYAMHELLREFAAEALDASGERAVVEEQHGRYYLAYLAGHGLRLGRHEPKEANAEIHAELDNIRQAWQWAARQGRLAELEQATYGWWQFCLFNNIEAEGQQSLAAAVAGVRAVLSRPPSDAFTRVAGQRLLAKLLALHAEHLFAQGRDEEMAAQAREAIRLGVASGGKEGEIHGTFVLGRALHELEQRHEAGELWRKSIQLIRDYQLTQPASEFLHDTLWRAHLWLRGSALHFGDYAGSRAYMVEALHIAQSLGKRVCELQSLACLGQSDLLTFEVDRAASSFSAALELARILGHRRAAMDAQDGLGVIAWLRGQYAEALSLLEQAHRTATECAFAYDESMLLAKLIRLHSQLGNRIAVTQRAEQLAKLLGRVNLPKECQLAAYLAAAIKAFYGGEAALALRYAEQARDLIEQGEILFRRVETFLILGHTNAAVGKWQPAAAAFQQALDAFTQIDKRALAAEPQAGLAFIALQQGQFTDAQAQVEAMLPLLATEPRVGYTNPYFVYFTCYQVLVAATKHALDDRAAALLQKGYDLLQQDAATLDEEGRNRFLTTVPLHRELIAAYHEWQEQRNKAASDKAATNANTASATSSHPAISRPPLRDWNEMPVVDFFTGRTAEMSQLTAWLTPSAEGAMSTVRLISVLGMGGMGKTTLAAAVTKAVAPTFSVVIWRSLLNAPPLNELLCNWLQLLSRQTLTAPPNTLDEQLRLLIEYLHKERCLLVLDNVESIFADDDPHGRAGATRPGYEGYDQLFLRLGMGEHQSCLLLTSREQPYALVRSSRQVQEGMPIGRIRSLSLAGLNLQAACEVLQSNGLHTSAQEAASLITNYSGNPLALQIVAATIADFFGGDIAAFEQEGGLFDGIRLVLDQQFARLSTLERDLLLWLAIEREAIPVQLLRANFGQSRSTRELLEALQALQNRSLLEKHDTGLTLQNVIIEYTTEYLIAQVCAEILTFGAWGLEADSNRAGNQSQTPDAKIQHSFFNRFPLLKAQTKAYIRQSQSRLIVQRIINRLLVQVGKAKLITMLQRIVALLQANIADETGYAAGNLLNLLVQLGVDLHGYDFSRLTIRQAYLQGATLTDVSLAHADLQQCVFTNIFGAVLSVAISPDNRLLAASSNDGIVRIWQLSDNQLYHICEGHTNVVRDVAFSPDGRWLASASLDQTIRLWEVATGQLYRVLEGQGSGVYCVVFCANGTVIASGSRDGKIQLWDRSSGRPFRVWHEHTDAVQRLVVAPGDIRLASASADQTIRLWALDSDQSVALLRGHTQNVTCLAFSPDGATLASGSADQTIRLWALDSGATRHVLYGHEHWLRAIAFNPEGTLVASASADQTIRLWDADTGKIRGVLQGHTNAVWALAFTADNKRLISGGTDHQIRIWDIQNPADSRTIDAIQAHVGAVLALAVSADGQLLATGDQHKLVRVWEMSSGQQVCTLAGHTDNVNAVAFSPDGRHLVSTGEDGAVRLWDIVQRREIKTLTGHPSHAHRVAYHPSGTLIASSGYQDTVRLWDMRPPAAGRLLRLLTPTAASDQESAFGVAFSPDGQWLASTHGGDKLCVWEVDSGRLLYTLNGHQKALEWLTWSPDGRLLTSGDVRGNIYLWDMRTPTLAPIRQFDARTYLWGLAFSPDSGLLASVGEDPLIRLWDVEGGECIRTFSGHTQNISSVAFLPDGNTMVSGSFDSTIRFWAVHSGALLATWHIPGPYAGLNIAGATGISDAQRMALRALGAVEK